MKISEIKGEQAIDTFAEIIEPLTAILADEEIKEADNKLEAIKIALKKYKREVITILALLEGENPETYEPTLFTLPAKLIEITDEPEVKTLFMSVGQTEENNSSGSVTENTKDGEK